MENNAWYTISQATNYPSPPPPAKNELTSGWSFIMVWNMSALCTSGNQSNDYVQFQYFFEKLTQAYICDRVKSSYTSSLFISPKKQKQKKIMHKEFVHWFVNTIAKISVPWKIKPKLQPIRTKLSQTYCVWTRFSLFYVSGLWSAK